MILGVNHVALSVPDMDRAIEFYSGLLGLEHVSEAGWEAGTENADKILAVPGTSARVVHLRGANVLFELFQFGDCEPVAQDPRRPVIDHGITHICFAVSDVQAEYERMKAEGMEFHSEPLDVGIPGVRTVYGRDPFGNVIEFEESAGRVRPDVPPGAGNG